MTTQSTVPTMNPAPSGRRVLVALSFEPTADAALLEGMDLAMREPDTELHVVHATNDADTVQATALLYDRIEALWQRRGPLQVTGHVRVGDAATVVLQAAVDIDADILIVGSHRRTGLRKLVLGSVAEQILYGAHCPILIALPKDYTGLEASPQIEPPCPECVRTREETANERFWCPRHSRPHLEAHVYVPREEEVGGRKSIMY